MKKIFAITVAFALLFSLVSCSSNNEKVQHETMTLSFAYGDRTGLYSGAKDENGLPHGYGTFDFGKSDGTGWTYAGEWNHGHWDGLGLTVWSTGESYSGYYKDDVINGHGIYTNASGVAISGYFINSTPNGHCAVYLNGDYEGYVFWGDFIDGDAKGIVYTPSGETIPAVYADNIIQFDVLSSEETTAVPQEPVTEEETMSIEESMPMPEVTTGMKNALWAAKNYLSIMAFSYTGLIEQLEYEGYSHEDAVYAADNCGADWNDQAAKAAQNYLDIMPFSRSGLIEQLEYEGFTHDQAVYGVDQADL